MSALRRLGVRLIGIADDPADDDDVRLRKRIGVAVPLRAAWLDGMGWLGTYVVYPAWSLVLGRWLTSD